MWCIVVLVYVCSYVGMHLDVHMYGMTRGLLGRHDIIFVLFVQSRGSHIGNIFGEESDTKYLKLYSEHAASIENVYIIEISGKPSIDII